MLVLSFWVIRTLSDELSDFFWKLRKLVNPDNIDVFGFARITAQYVVQKHSAYTGGEANFQTRWHIKVTCAGCTSEESTQLWTVDDSNCQK